MNNIGLRDASASKKYQNLVKETNVRQNESLKGSKMTLKMYTKIIENFD